jgi:hypothetical protein
MRRLACATAILLATATLSAQTRTTKALTIYVVDVEGGNATLIVAPTGESLLIDTGNTGAGAVRCASAGAPPNGSCSPMARPPPAAAEFTRKLRRERLAGCEALRRVISRLLRPCG